MSSCCTSHPQQPSSSSSSEPHQASHVVTIEASSPIRASTTPIGLYALIIGLILVIHTPTWILLLQYQENDDNKSNNANKFLKAISYIILEWTPWFASTVLCFFLAGLFMYLGLAKINNKM